MKLFTITAVALAALGVDAHGGVWNYIIGGKSYAGYKYWDPDSPQRTIQRRWWGRPPLMNPLDPNMACNVDGSVVKPSLHAPIHAGGTIVAHYEKNFSLPGEEGADPHEFWGHAYGPIIVYMANCGGPCDNFVPNGTVWFKVWEAGLLNGTISDDSWAMSAVSEQGAPVVMNIPKNLKAGYYLIRHELIAVHNSPSQIQFYMECAQLQVLGRGAKTPSKDYLVSFPGAYQWSDPGISINFYQSRDNTTYQIPGPKVWKG